MAHLHDDVLNLLLVEVASSGLVHHVCTSQAYPVHVSKNSKFTACVLAIVLHV